MITLIGTGHIFDLSQPLLKIFEEKKPDILCVELDKERYNALLIKQRDPKGYEKYGRNLPLLYKMLARFQDNLAKKYGVEAGEEMITTINYAQTHNLPLAFIDMNAQVLFIKMLKSMSIREKIKMFLSGLSGLFVSKRHVEEELKRIEEDFDKYITEIENTFPTVKKILVDERNEYMVDQLVSLNEQYKNIIAVVGDGHIPGMSKLLKEKGVEFGTVRLKDLLSSKDLNNKDTSTASFSLEYKAL